MNVAQLKKALEDYPDSYDINIVLDVSDGNNTHKHFSVTDLKPSESCSMQIMPVVSLDLKQVKPEPSSKPCARVPFFSDEFQRDIFIVTFTVFAFFFSLIYFIRN